MPSSACSCHHPYVHSFPTRRSSDLVLRTLGEGEEQLLERRRLRRQGHDQRAGLDQRLRELRDRVLAVRGEQHLSLLEARVLDARLSRSEEHTSELQSRQYLVCRLLPAPATTRMYTLSLHDALPISSSGPSVREKNSCSSVAVCGVRATINAPASTSACESSATVFSPSAVNNTCPCWRRASSMPG